MSLVASHRKKHEKFNGCHERRCLKARRDWFLCPFRSAEIGCERERERERERENEQMEAENSDGREKMNLTGSTRHHFLNINGPKLFLFYQWSSFFNYDSWIIFSIMIEFSVALWVFLSPLMVLLSLLFFSNCCTYNICNSNILITVKCYFLLNFSQIVEPKNYQIT